jgi:guanylate kinase
MVANGAMIPHTGNVFVISAPSGTGKSTLTQRLVSSLEGLIFSISTTTRSPREGEVEGKDYFFVDGDTFDRMVAEGGFLEWVEVYGNRYGTGRDWIIEQLGRGVDVLLDIETMGAAALKERMPDAIMIFLLPPSAAELERRLRGRGKDSQEQIGIRLAYARHELEHFAEYDHLIVNDDLETAYRQLESVVLAARSRRPRMENVARQLLAEF